MRAHLRHLRLGIWLAAVVLIICRAHRTEAAPAQWPVWANAVVAADGTGQFRSLQAAIAAAPGGTREKRWIIHVRPGVYKERLYIQREKRFLAIVGEDPEKTVVTYDLHANLEGPDGKPIGTFATATAFIDADDFRAENLTFENTGGRQGQALAVRVDGDRVFFRNCRFVGWQDTVLLNRGRQYFEDTFISGHVDFIFGGATAFFERCRIVARGDGYITAASTPPEEAHGFVFSRCSIRGESSEVRTYLGRPWRAHASVTFLDTDMSDAVRPEGWHNWDQPGREKTVRYAELGTTGPGADVARRVPWARRLTREEAAALTSAKVLGGQDGWDPQAEGALTTETRRTSTPPPAASEPRCPAPARLRADVEYVRRGPVPLRLDVCLPAGKGPFPAALLVHGGGWTSGDKKEAAVALVRPLIEAGIAWIAVQYRLAPAHQFPAPVEDVEAAVRWTKKNGSGLGLDPARLALVGESAGGQLVALAAVRAGEDTRVAAVVPFFAPVDLESDTERRGGLSLSLRALFGRTEVDAAATDLLREASPIRHARAGLPPFLLVHGTADMSVPYEQSRRMQSALRAVGVPADLITVPEGTHGTRDWDPLLPDFRKQVVAWLAERLAPPRLIASPSSLVGATWRTILEHPPAWYGEAEAKGIADTVLLYQRDTGGWPKNIDMARAPTEAEHAVILAQKAATDSTIDNGATFTQLRYLARVYEATQLERFRSGFLRGLDYLLAAQYPNGGWPQFFPLRDDYSRHITFNDGAMVGVLSLLDAIAAGQPPFAFVEEARRARARDAVGRGIDVVLATQVRVAGVLTVWCAQHDARTLGPESARTYEHASLSGSESVGIVRFLMSIPQPSPQVVDAVEAAVAWFRQVAIRDRRVERRAHADLPGGYDNVVVEQPGAPALWARFYEIGTNRPIFSGRDGIVKDALADIEHERRIGYIWLGPFAQGLLEQDYPAWTRRRTGG